MSIRIGDQAQDVIDAEGITLPQLEDMLARAAITSLRGATRRYHHWFFVYDVKRKFVEKMFMHLDGMDEVYYWSNCTKCQAWGCPSCQYSGQVPS